MKSQVLRPLPEALATVPRRRTFEEAHGPGVWPLVCSGRVALDGPAGGVLAGTSLDMVKAMAVGRQTAGFNALKSRWP